jgi:type I restriction enzyme S subunit
MMPSNDLPDNFKETEIGPIPVDWEVVTVGSVGQVVTGTTPPTKEPEYYGGPYMFISPGDIGGAKYVTRTHKHLSEAGLKVSRQLPRHTVLVVCIGATIGKTAMTVAEQSATNQQINAVIANEEVFADYLYYALTHRSPRLPDLAGRAAVPIVNKSNFAKFLIPIAPLPEQRRIAHVLSTIQRAIAAQDDLIAAAREVKRSLMQRLFTYGPVPETASTKETEIGEIPEHWDVVRLGEVLQTTQYGLSVRADLTGTYPMLRMNNLEDGYIDASDLKYVDLEERDFAKFRVRKRDVLFNRTNSYELVGKTAIFDIEGDFVFASYLIRVVPDFAQLLPEYLNYYLNWDDAQRRLKMLATRGVSQSNISATKLKRFSIGLSSVTEQEEIARILSAADHKIEAEEQRKAALQALFKAMLHQLMTGQLRLPKSER